MNEALNIAPGHRVTMHFSIILEDGTKAESTLGGEPLTFVVGDGSVMQGVEEALYGMQAGDEQTLTLSPEQAYGLHDPANVHSMPRADFADDLELKPGLIISFHTPDGNDVPGMIMGVTGDNVTVDFNHPLAGHELIFKVRILDVENV